MTTLKAAVRAAIVEAGPDNLGRVVCESENLRRRLGQLRRHHVVLHAPLPMVGLP